MNRAQQAQFSVYQSQDVLLYHSSNQPQDADCDKPLSKSSESGVAATSNDSLNPFKNGRHSLLNSGERENYAKISNSTSAVKGSLPFGERTFPKPTTTIKAPSFPSKDLNSALKITPILPYEDAQPPQHSNISPLHRLALSSLLIPQSEPKTTSPIVEIFNLQQQEYNKVLEQMLTFKDQNAKLVDLLNEQHISMDQMIRLFSKFENELSLSTKEASPQSDYMYRYRGFEQRRSQRATSQNARLGSIVSHQEILNCLDQSRRIHEKVQRYLTELDIYDLRRLSALKSLFQRQRFVSASNEEEKQDLRPAPLCNKGKGLLYKPQTVYKRVEKPEQQLIYNRTNIRHELSEQAEEEQYDESDDFEEDGDKLSIMSDEQSFQQESEQFHEKLSQQQLQSKRAPDEVILISQDIPEEDDDEEEPIEEEDDGLNDEEYSISEGKRPKNAKNQKKKKGGRTLNPAKKVLKVIQKKPSQALKKSLKDVNKSKFICHKCGEQFHSGWALGGHASRVHPGESESYKRKIQRREERHLERQLLQMAKQKHYEMYGEDAPINRVKIRKFKKELKKTLFGSVNYNTRNLMELQEEIE